MNVSLKPTGIALLAAVGCSNIGPSLPDHIDAKENVALFADGTRVELYRVDTANSNQPEDPWTPAGVPIVNTPNRIYVGTPTTPTVRRRRLYFHIANRGPDADVECYIPDGEPMGLDYVDQRAHGFALGGWPGARTYDQEVYLTVDQPTASHCLFGLASGPYRNLGTFPNLFRSPNLKDGQVVLSGKGWKTVAHPPVLGEAAKGVIQVELETLSNDGTYTTDYDLQAFDAKGKKIGAGPRGETYIYGFDLRPVDHFVLKARDYHFALFSDIHFDPVR